MLGSDAFDCAVPNCSTWGSTELAIPDESRGSIAAGLDKKVEEERIGFDPFKLSKWEAPIWDNEPKILCIEETSDVAMEFPRWSENVDCWHCESTAGRDDCAWLADTEGKAGITLEICCGTGGSCCVS